VQIDEKLGKTYESKWKENMPSYEGKNNLHANFAHTKLCNFILFVNVWVRVKIQAMQI
jgi:hypothetical protein